MTRWLVAITSTLGGAAGWWLGDVVGGGILGAFIVSMIGTGIGIYAGKRITQEYFD